MKENSNVLNNAPKWQLQMDLGNQPKFPDYQNNCSPRYDNISKYYQQTDNI